MNRNYRVIIIGGSPAGLTAGLYCARSGFESLLIEKGVGGTDKGRQRMGFSFVTKIEGEAAVNQLRLKDTKDDTISVERFLSSQ